MGGSVVRLGGRLAGVAGVVIGVTALTWLALRVLPVAVRGRRAGGPGAARRLPRSDFQHLLADVALARLDPRVRR